MKKLFKNKWFIVASTITIVILLIFLTAYALLGNDLFGGSVEIFSMLVATQIHWWILGIVIGLIVFALLIVFVLPFLLYVLVKLSTYVSLLLVCLKEKHSCKITRFPFSSLGEISEKADIEVKMSHNKFFVHFVDVPFGFRKKLTFLDENNYQIASSTPGSLKRIGGGPPGGKFSGGQTTAFYGKERESTDINKKCRSIPNFQKNDNEYHYLIVTPGYVNANVIVGNGANDISSETIVGKIMVCKYKTLKKRLKNQLYTPINKN